MFFEPPLGELVRPKCLFDGEIFNIPQNILNNPVKISSETIHEIMKHNPSREYSNIYNFFNQLSLGETTKLWKGDSYVCKIHSLIGMHGYNNYFFVNDLNLPLIKKKYKRTKYSPYYIWAGVKIYRTFDNNFIEGEPFLNEKTGEHETWYYRVYQLLPLHHIVNYESLESGDLVEFPRSKAFVVSNRKEQKERSICFSSWTSRCVSVIPIGKRYKSKNEIRPLSIEKRVISVSK